MNFRYTIFLLFFLLLNASFRLNLASPNKLFTLTGLAQGTSYQIKYKYPVKVVSQEEIDSIFRVFSHSLSRYDKSSLLYKLNSAKSRSKIDSHLFAVINYAQEIRSLTMDCFDYRLLPLIQLWGFGTQHSSTLPDAQKVNKLLDFIRSTSIQFNDLTAVKSSKNLKLDLDGIAQGYCVDQLSMLLKKKGIRDYVVELGGEVFVAGTNLDNNYWEIGLGDDHLYAESKQKMFLTGMDHLAVTTSGSLQKFKKIGNQYFSHIIDPRTGYPVKNGIISVTVIAPNAMQADALDNAFMVMGVKESFEWCKNYSSIGVYFSYVNPTGEVVDTANGYFRQFIQYKN